MNNRYKYLFKNAGILTISNFSSKILTFLLVPLYTSILSTQDYGVYDLIISTVQLFFPIITLNILDAVMRFTMDKNNSREQIISIAFKYIVISYIIVGFFLLIAHFARVPLLQKYESLIFFYYFTYVLYQFAIQFAKGMEMITPMAIAGIIGTISLLGFNILFLIILNWGLPGFYLASICAQVLPAIYLIFRTKLWQYLKRINDKKLKIEMLRYSIPLILSTISWWINTTSDKYVVTFICGAAANGILSVAYKIPSIITTLQNIFMQAWTISAIKEYDNLEHYDFYQTVFEYLNLMMCFACSTLIILTKPIAYILYAHDFYEAWKYVPLLLVSSVFNASSGFIGPILIAQKNSNAMAKSAAYGACANIVLNVLFVNMLGIQGAAIATVISSFIIFIIRNRAVGKMLHTQNFKIILIAWILLCGQALVQIYMDSYFLQLIIIILLIILYWRPGMKLIGKIIRKRIH